MPSRLPAPSELPPHASAAILAFPEATAPVLDGLGDLLHFAGRDWGMIVAARPEPFTIANGVRIVADATLEEAERPDLECIPELLIAPGESLAGRYEREIAWLLRCHAQGASLAAACSGALLLAEAGRLDGEAATTHWACCDALAERFARVRVQRQRALVAAGEGQRLIMAGGGSSWLDRGLFLIARLAGVGHGPAHRAVGTHPGAALPAVHRPQADPVHPDGADRGGQAAAGDRRHRHRGHRQRTRLRGPALLRGPVQARGEAPSCASACASWVSCGPRRPSRPERQGWP